MNKAILLLLWGPFMLFSSSHLNAAAGLTNGFETYVRGVLDANYVASPNQAPNGGPGNPWWSPYSPGLRVVGTDTNIVAGVITNVVTPHGGTNMVRGAKTGVADFDQDYLNVAYRANQSNVFAGNVTLDWWFFDTVGTNSPARLNYQDYVSLAYSTMIPTNTDYMTDGFGSPDPGFALAQLSLGASYSQGGAFNATNYQAQILHTTASNAYDATDGWFNLPVMRSVGWHRGRIAVSPALPDGSANVRFYVDNMTNALLTNSTATTNGFNCISFQAEYTGSLTGYYDDVTVDVPPPVLLTATKSGNNVVVSWTVQGWTLQSSTNADYTGFVDNTNATSPYTNAIGPAPTWFRLKQ